ncbi:MAG: T9SS type A sorting domain-containing protein [Candidatus Cloacimonetes bacterium]|nr:T9SS type A sorting domain-containing protein [Candidatus Cloacimonadota bacterium]
MSHLTSLLIALCAPALLLAQTSENCSLLAQLPSVHGASSVQVRESIAWVGFGSAGLRVLDLAEPAAPLTVGSWNPNSYGSAGMLALAGDVLWVSNGSQIRSLDISDPGAIQLLGSTSVPSTVEALVAADGRLYVVSNGSGLTIMDTSRPDAPSVLAHVASPSEWLGAALVRGNRLYLAEGSEGVRILDVSDPGAILELGTFDTWFATGLDLVGHLLYVADDMAGLRILDVSDPANPVQLGLIDTPGWAEHVKVSGDLAYVSDHFHGLRIIDVHDPASPLEVGYYETGGSARQLALLDDLVLLCDAAEGLLVLRHDALTAVDPAPVALPTTAHLLPVAPNPFNPRTLLRLELDRAQEITLTVYNIEGRRVATLAHGRWAAGEHSLPFESGHLPSGVYFAELRTAAGSQTQRMLLLR